MNNLNVFAKRILLWAPLFILNANASANSTSDLLNDETQVGSQANVIQSGKANAIAIEQKAHAAITAHAAQSGSAAAKTGKSDEFNSTIIEQNGVANKVDVIQNGHGNELNVKQSGNENKVDAKQYGKAQAGITQTGHSNAISVTQPAGSKKLTVNQNTDRSVLKIIQY